MEGYQIFTLVVLIVSLIVQAVSIASQALALDYYKYQDNQSATATNVRDKAAYAHFVIFAGSVSMALYIVLLIVKLVPKTLGKWKDFLIFMFVLLLQFALGAVQGINLTNDETLYNTNESTIATLNAAGFTG